MIMMIPRHKLQLFNPATNAYYHTKKYLPFSLLEKNVITMIKTVTQCKYMQQLNQRIVEQSSTLVLNR